MGGEEGDITSDSWYMSTVITIITITVLLTDNKYLKIFIKLFSAISTDKYKTRRWTNNKIHSWQLTA